MENLETDVAALHCGDRDGKLFQKWQSEEIFFLCMLGMEALQVYNGCDPNENDTKSMILYGNWIVHFGGSK